MVPLELTRWHCFFAEIDKNWVIISFKVWGAVDTKLSMETKIYCMLFLKNIHIKMVLTKSRNRRKIRHKLFKGITEHHRKNK